MNELYQALGGMNAKQAMNPYQMLRQLKSDPVGMLKQAGLTIPDGMTNPQAIVNHLITSGQIPQGRLQQAMNMMRNK